MTNPPIGDGDHAVANDAFDEAHLASRRATILASAGAPLERGARRRRARRTVFLAAALAMAAILAWPTMRPTSVGDRTTARHAPSQPRARAIDFAAIATRAKPIDARRVGTPVARTIDARTIGPRASRTALLTLERIDDRAAEAEFEAAGTCVRIVRIDGRARALGCG
jgi:hypothetical protein